MYWGETVFPQLLAQRCLAEETLIRRYHVWMKRDFGLLAQTHWLIGQGHWLIGQGHWLIGQGHWLIGQAHCHFARRLRYGDLAVMRHVHRLHGIVGGRLARWGLSSVRSCGRRVYWAGAVHRRLSGRGNIAPLRRWRVSVVKLEFRFDWNEEIQLDFWGAQRRRLAGRRRRRVGSRIFWRLRILYSFLDCRIDRVCAQRRRHRGHKRRRRREGDGHGRSLLSGVYVQPGHSLIQTASVVSAGRIPETSNERKVTTHTAPTNLITYEIIS